MTYSIAARCEKTGAFGIAITSSSICVASRCAWVGPLGAVSTQNITDPGTRSRGARLLRQGLGAGAVLDLLLAGTPQPECRQVGVIDRYGMTALHSGREALPLAAFAQGPSALRLATCWPRAKSRSHDRGFTEAAGEMLAERLMRGLEAGFDAGGETGDEHAAGLHVADVYDWPVVDLRVDWHDEPIAELRRIWTLYAPQRAAYEARARAPGSAPSF